MIFLRVTWLQQLCGCHHCCAAAATAAQQALAAGAPDCGIADPWIDVHARMAITMLLISRRNRTCRLSCVSKRSAIMEQSRCKFVCHESKILAQKKWTGFIQHMEKRKTGSRKETWTGFEKRRKESRRIYREMCLPQSVDGVIVLSEILS